MKRILSPNEKASIVFFVDAGRIGLFVGLLYIPVCFISYLINRLSQNQSQNYQEAQTTDNVSVRCCLPLESKNDKDVINIVLVAGLLFDFCAFVVVPSNISLPYFGK